MKRLIGLVTAFVLITMMVCPAIAAAHSNNLKTNNHCSSEEQPQDHEQTMHGCCDQNAISVQKVHARFEALALYVVLPMLIPGTQVVPLFDSQHLPYQKTGDHLSKLSVLRL